jgi:hypothetical protein
VTRTDPFANWQTADNPYLIPGPGGTVQLLMTGAHSSASTDPLNGTSVAQRAATGAFGSPVPLSPTVTCCVTGATTAANGSTPLWAASPAYNLLVFSGATENDLTSDSPPQSTTSGFGAVGRDASGRAWLAWYVFSESGAAGGLYMMQLNPQTGASAAPAVHVPDTNGEEPAYGLRIGLACAQICRIIYDPESDSSAIDTWAPGDGQPQKAFSGLIGDQRQGPENPQAVYTSDGRLWVEWTDTESNRMYAELGDSRGAGGTPIELQKVRGYPTPGDGALATTGDRLAVAGTWTDGTGAISAVFATLVDPEQ